MKKKTIKKVSDLRNKEIKDFIYGTYKRIKPDDTLVVLSNNSKASESLKNSQKLQKTISTNLASIKNGEYENKFLGVNFSEGNNFVEKLSSTNMIAAYNRLSLYNPHFDENHNLKMYALDYVDYEQNTPQNPLNAINNNAYNLQNTGVVSPYLKIIELKFTPAEYKNFLK